ncbi:MAG: hypothetical protein RMX96_27540 [Nostoc sp. ChiSLP02]|nr:hypothetical protein [Nostoc sp. DedSLP05]MDZ8100946.1 hypothetical protein [Nostoc sp. DedSLP01]MDZ8188595.1 hypothetical protein [Nostoc sp. ChiSLP02]
MIEILTPERKALVPHYQEKWRNIALSTERIDEEKAENAIKEAYALINLSEPEVIFCDSPLEAKEIILASYKLGRGISNQFNIKLLEQLKEELINRSGYELSIFLEVWEEKLEEELSSKIWFYIMLHSEIEKHIYEPWLRIEQWISYGSCFDFCISILDLAHSNKIWQVFQALVSYCGLIIPFEQIAIICNRPIKISFDNQQRLHAEGKAAVQFADGFSLYASHGVIISEE